jgi:hypothetical protein
VLDLTPGDGTFAKCALTQEIIYVGIVMSDLHGEILREELLKFILTEMANEASPMYDTRYALYKKNSASASDPKKETPNPTPRKDKRKRTKKEDDKEDDKDKGKKAKKSKKKSSSSSASSSSSDSHSE